MVIFNFKYHALFATLFFILIAKYSHLILGFPAFLGMLLSFSLPDVDKTTTKPGRKLKTLSKITSLFCDHRGFTHSFVAMIIVLIISAITGSIQFMTGVLIGYSSHLISDMSTPMGIKLLWPIPIHFRIPIISHSKFISGLLWIVVFVVLIFDNHYNFSQLYFLKDIKNYW